jgi:hypothetical protein
VYICLYTYIITYKFYLQTATPIDISPSMDALIDTVSKTPIVPTVGKTSPEETQIGIDKAVEPIVKPTEVKPTIVKPTVVKALPTPRKESIDVLKVVFVNSI